MSRDKTSPDKSEPTWMSSPKFFHKCVKLVPHSCPTVASQLLRKQVRTKMSRPEMSSPMTSAVRDSWEECPDLLSSSQFLLLTFICVLNSKTGDRAHKKKWIKAPLCQWERLDMWEIICQQGSGMWGRGTYTGRGHKGEWGIQRCSRVKDVRSNFLRPSNPFEFFCRTNPFVHIPQCFLHSVNVNARNRRNGLECN